VCCGNSRPIPTEGSARYANAAFAWECEARGACIRPPLARYAFKRELFRRDRVPKQFVPIKYPNRFFARPTPSVRRMPPKLMRSAAWFARSDLYFAGCLSSIGVRLFTPRQAIDFRQISHELGIRYVLHGSARRADNRIRVRGQLIDATALAHAWTEHYDCHLTKTAARDYSCSLRCYSTGTNSARARVTSARRPKHTVFEA